MSNKQLPITRVNKFFSADDFQLEVDFGREYLEGDLNMTLVLFQVDRDLTETDSIYGETVVDGIRYHTPIEVKGLVDFATPENKVYNPDGSGRYLQDGQLTFVVYQKHLEELDADITYGDYVGYQIDETNMRYFTVANDGRKNYDNPHTIMGYRGAWRTILCVPVDSSEFKGV